MAASRSKKKKRDGFPKKRVDQKRIAKQQLFVFTIKFSFASLFTITSLSLLPEDLYSPLNRLTAFFSGEILRLFTLDIVVKDSFISIGSFRANVIAECSSINLIILFGAFIFAFPSKLKAKLIGVCTGALFIYVVNIIRIALISYIGWRFPAIFDAVHIYLGQLVMMIVMICSCIYWCQWASDSIDMRGSLSYIVRFLILSSSLFLIWLPLNRIYVKGTDNLVKWLFILISRPIEIYISHAYYYQTFSLITLSGFIMAFKNAKLSVRFRWIIYGFSVLTVFLVLIKVCNVWFVAFSIEWMRAVSQVIYNICVYALPGIFALRFFINLRMQKRF